MYQINFNKRGLRSTLLLGAASVAAIGLTAPASAQSGGAVETVVVTGSRIPQAGLYSTSPVTAIGQGEIKLTGTTDVENLLDSLPAVFVSQNSTSNNGSSGTATINLRGLGAARTLVLVDGTRLMPGDPTLPEADVNTIPASMVDHIEVLTGGASAVYGSDAVAGVVNFIMRKDFEGIELDGQYSADQHNNNNGYADKLYAAAGFSNPITGASIPGAPSSVFDGENQNATLILGANTDNGKGNVTAYLGYWDSAPILENSRDFSACTLGDSAHDTARRCKGSANYSLFISIDNAAKGGVASPTYFGVGNGKQGSGAFNPFTGASSDYFNYGGLNYLQRNDLRYNGGFFAHYEANKELDVYSDFMFTDNRSTSQLAPAAVFAGGGPVSGAFNSVNCTNPYLTAQENQIICGRVAGDNQVTTGAIVTALGHPYWDGAANLIPGSATMEIGRRDLEGGNRTYTTEHESYRMKIGAKGDLGDGWSYDVYGQFGYTNFNESDGGQFSVKRVQDALNVDPITGQCLSGNAGCVGLNIFNGFGGITPQALGYVGIPALVQGYTKEQILSGSVTGDLGAYGMQSPWAKSPVAVSLGSEYRAENLSINPDLEETSGDLEGGSALKTEAGGFNVTEGFTEVRVPVIQDMPFIEDFTLNGGYRYSSYNISGSTSAYKYGGEWQPVDDVRFRASYERAVRAPNVLELFAPDVAGLFTGQDPCSGAGAPSAQVAHNCQTAPGRAAVPANLVGSNLLNCIASQCEGLAGGNIHLKPETSDTRTVGFVLTPTFIDGFTATVDYFDIKVVNAIGVVPPTTALSQCYGATATPGSQAAFCPLILRNLITHQINNPTGLVSETNINTGNLITKGFDLEANYNTDLDSWGVANSGSLSFNFIGTWLSNLTTTPVDNALGSYNCAGLYGLTCSSSTGSSSPNPKWRQKVRVTWESPWDFSLSLAWRYFGHVSLDSDARGPGTLLLNPGGTATNAIEQNIPAFNWFDLAGTWDVRPGVSLTAGVNNIFDKDPPITAIQPLPAGNANTFPGSYDSLGRVMFINGTIKY